MNKVILSRRLTKDAELRYTPGKGTPMTQVSLAVENYNANTKEKGADFINLVVFGKQAELLATYSGKGKRIEVAGSIRGRSYEKDGIKKYITEVIVRDLELIDWINGDSNNRLGYEEPTEDPDIPF